MEDRKNLTGQMFGKWKVLYQIKDNTYSKGANRTMWMCECQCDKHTIRAVSEYSLINELSKSCGCSKKGKNNLKNRRENIYDLNNQDYGIGYTQSGKEFYFDKEDYNLVSRYCWDIDKSTGYVKTIDRINKTGKLYLHRLIMGCIKGDKTIVDHINRNKIDCRKNNLRIVNDTQSAINKGVKNNNTSGKIGVSWDKDCNKWHSYITVNKVRINLGYYDNFEDAKEIRIKAEKEYFGEYNPIIFKR